jgi:phosphatidylinositol phospholipase C delta
VLCADVIEAIRKFAFKTTPYPLILSIENHCSLPLQQKMAEIMRTGLGEMLAMPMSTKLSSAGSQLPSPEELKYKVLIKGKRVGSVDDEDDDDEDDDDDDDDGGRRENLDSQKSKDNKNKDCKDGKGDGHGESTHPQLSEVTYLATGKVKSFDSSGNLHIPGDSMCSFSESATSKKLKDRNALAGWIRHNQKHLR